MRHSAAIIIPIRSGSKRLPNKWIQDLGGYQLWRWTYTYAKRHVPQNTRHAFVFVTTDVGYILGAIKPDTIRRPSSMCADHSPVEDAVKHVCDEVNVPPDHYIVVANPTSPYRQDGMWDKAIDIVESNGWHGCVFGVKSDRWRWQNGHPQQYLKGAAKPRTQDMLPEYIECGDYIVKAEHFYGFNRLVLGKTGIVPLDNALCAVDIDTETDLRIARGIAHEYELSPGKPMA